LAITLAPDFKRRVKKSLKVGNVEYKARNNPEKIEVKFDNALAFIQSKLK
jgi:hypothetical protein